MHPQKDGRFYVGFAPTVGRVAGTTARPRSPTWPRRTARGRVRTTTEQKLIVLDVRGAEVDSLVAGAGGARTCRSSPSPFRRDTMACTGIEFCKLAIVETKARGAALIDELERRLPDFDVPITINVNGCPNACARIQIADIGLKGQLVTDADGDQVEGFQVHLGGGSAWTPASAARSAASRSPRPSCPTTSSGC